MRDSTGAVIPDGAITVTYPDTGLKRTISTNSSGVFFITSLPLGHVGVEASKSGFRSVRLETDLNVGETKTIDLSLEVGTVDISVQVISSADLGRDSDAIGAAFENTQISKLPINGRAFGNLMALAPGAVDTGGSTVRFVGHGPDDTNLRIDGVDATAVRNQTQKSRLVLSTDAIAEFRINEAMYTAESGGAPSGQIEVVTKSGSNQFHGSLFEYLRNSALDSRSPFDGPKLPSFRLNQFGGTVGGKIIQDKTFFFLSYEGLIQRQGRTQTGFVPSEAFRSNAVAAIQPLLNLYPIGQTPVANNPNVMQWKGVGSATQDEHVGLLRVDHHFNDRFSSYFRLSKNSTESFTPNTALPVGTRNLDEPQSALLDFLYLISPRTTNELRIAANYAEPLNSISQSGVPIAVSVPNLSSLPADTRRIAFGITESMIDQWSTLRGNHTLKAGVEFKRLQLIIHDGANAQAGTITFNSLADFQNARITTLEYSAELPTKQMRKPETYVYGQDEWKISPNFTANLGLRYEYFSVFREIHDRAIPFDIQTCGGYCPAGSAFAFPDRNNFAPRVSFAWSPKALHDRTVIRFGGGVYYGDAQLGDAYSPANNDATRFTLSIATTPGLSYPIDSYIATSPSTATAPRSMPRNKRNEVSQQWGAAIQHAFTNNINFQISYLGQENYHVFNRNYVNVLDPVTRMRPLPAIDQVDVRGEDGVSSYHGLISTLQINNLKGLLLRVNYAYSHAIDDGSSGGGGSDGAPQNVACRSCDKGNSSIDVRHVFSTNFAYQLPFAGNRRFGGWELSGIAVARAGLPLNITVSRSAASLPDGNTLSAERPNLVPGVPLYLDYATTGRWLNIAAFAVPTNGDWGNLGRNTLRGPGQFQVDMALLKRTRLTERFGLEFGVQVFNIANHPQLGNPATNISSSANFGRITTPINTTPIGSGTPRQIQFLSRLAF
ncbi:MAG: TonB-dependent receptor [Chloracidobacterium sp.]|nr:TonB-dependent receptor [Chloracidobacterium sp.]